MSIARGLDTYKHYDKVIIVWGARFKTELPLKSTWKGYVKTKRIKILYKINFIHT